MTHPKRSMHHWTLRFQAMSKLLRMRSIGNHQRQASSTQFSISLIWILSHKSRRRGPNQSKRFSDNLRARRCLKSRQTSMAMAMMVHTSIDRSQLPSKTKLNSSRVRRLQLRVTKRLSFQMLALKKMRITPRAVLDPTRHSKMQMPRTLRKKQRIQTTTWHWHSMMTTTAVSSVAPSNNDPSIMITSRVHHSRSSLVRQLRMIISQQIRWMKVMKMAIATIHEPTS